MILDLHFAQNVHKDNIKMKKAKFSVNYVNKLIQFLD